MTIVLYTAPSAWGSPSISPFCTKLETYLRMRGLAYQPRFGDPRRAPKGKVPFIEYQGRLIADSQFAIERLEADADAPLDGWLSAAQRAEGHLLRRALEEGLYFAGAWLRWFDEPSWRVYAPVFYPYLPPVIGRALLGVIRRRIASMIYAQGTGRHSRAEIEALARRDVDALATALGDRPFALGDRPSTVDATVFSMIAAVIEFPVATPLSDATRAHANLVSYHARIRAAYFADWRPVVADGRRG